MSLERSCSVSLSDFRQDLGVIGVVSCFDQKSHLEILKSMEKISNGYLTNNCDHDLILSMRKLEEKLTNRVRAILKDKGINMTQLAERAGITQGYLNELMNLNPRKRWNADHIDKISSALGVDAWQLFIDPKEVIPRDVSDLLRKYELLDGDGKRIVDALLTAASVEPPRTEPKSHIKKGRTT